MVCLTKKVKKILRKVSLGQITKTAGALELGVSRKTLYVLLKGKSKRLTKKDHLQKYIKNIVISAPAYGPLKISSELKKKDILLSSKSVWQTLKGMNLGNINLRSNFAYNYNKSLRLTPDARKRMVESRDLAKYKVSRKTYSKWNKRYQIALDNGSNILESFSDNYLRGSFHPKGVSSELENKILAIVINNPEYSSHVIAQKIGTVGNHGVQGVLERNNLSHFNMRKAYAVSKATTIIPTPTPTPVFGRIKSVFETFVPNLAPAPPPAFLSILKTFAITLSLTFATSLSLVYWISIIGAASSFASSIGLIFATLALFMGSFFFLYSLKYYISLAIVLSYSQNEAGDKNEESGNSNFMQWLLGEKKKISVNGGTGSVTGLKSNLDDVTLNDHPFVSVHVALYNEKNVVERLAKAVCSFDYDNYEVILADDSTDETSDKITEYQKKYLFKGECLKITKGEGWTLTEVEVRQGVTLKHLHRTSRSGFKGAALALALKLSDPKTQYVSIFDADFVPYSDSLTSFLKYFQINSSIENCKLQIENCSRVAAVQGYQWHVLNKSENWVTRGVRTEYSGSYVIERAGTEIYGGLKQISGSVYMIKKDALQEVGWGTSITEDFELTLKLYNAGYKVIYTPYIQAPAECVSTLKRMVKQRMRWAEGHSFNIKKMFVKLITSPKLSFAEKFEITYLAPYYLQAAFFLVGTFSWLISETIFKVRLPFWTELWGWSLVLTNMVSLPLLNSVGLFLEESEQKDYSGIPSFVALSYIMVPFQAYAAIKGFLEKEEGGWFRTPKSGRVTDTFARSKFYRFIQGFIPNGNRAPVLEESYLSLSSSNNRFDSYSNKIQRKINGKRIIRILSSLSLIFSLLTHQLVQQSYRGNDYSIKNIINTNNIVIESDKKSFAFNETPKFSIKLKTKPAKNKIEVQAAEDSLKVKIYSRGKEVAAKANLEALGSGQYKLMIEKPLSFKPGIYTTKVSYTSDQKSYEETQDFSWGVLSWNTNKSVYGYNEKIKFGIGVIDDAGRTICDAKLNVTIAIPSIKKTTTFSTEDGSINKSLECGPQSVTNNPDYFGEFESLNQTETYSVHIVSKSYNGVKEIDEVIQVVNDLPFEIERASYPSRIYPLGNYEVAIRIKAGQDFSGYVYEHLPSDEFRVNLVDKESFVEGTDIVWKVNWEAGKTYDIKYRLTFPPVSPAFYSIGPLKLKVNDELVFSEYRAWQVAADSVTFQEVQNGTIEDASATVTSVVTSANLTAVNDDLYLAAVSTKPNKSIDSVSGLGLTWTLVVSQCADRNNTNTAIFWAKGSPTGDGTVTANLNGGTGYNGGAAISVARYSNVASSPIGNTEVANTAGVGASVGTCDATGTDSNAYDFSTIDTSQANSIVFYAVGKRQRNNTSGANWNERADIVSSVGGSNAAGVAIADQTFASVTSNLRIDGTLSGTSDWSLVAVEIKTPENPWILFGSSPVLFYIFKKRKTKTKNIKI